jgi:hypothetical protein
MPLIHSDFPNPQAVMLGKQHLRKIMLGVDIVWQRRYRGRREHGLRLESLAYRGIRLRATNDNGNLRYPMHFLNRRQTGSFHFLNRLTFIAKQPSDVSMESMDSMLQADVVAAEMWYPMFFFHGDVIEGYNYLDKLTFIGEDADCDSTDFIEIFEVNAYCPVNDFIKDVEINAFDETKDFSRDVEVNAYCPEKDFIEDVELEAFSPDFSEDVEVNVFCPTNDFSRDVEVNAYCPTKDFIRDVEVNAFDQARDFIRNVEVNAYCPFRDFIQNFNVTPIILTPPDLMPRSDWKDVIFAEDKFVVVGLGGRIITSPDGFDWTEIPGHESRPDLYGIAYGNGRYVAVGEWTIVSTNLTDWTRPSQFEEHPWYGVAYGNNSFVSVGDRTDVMKRSNSTGTTWSLLSPAFGITHPQPIRRPRIIRAGNMFVVADDQTGISSSSTGATWTARLSGDYQSVAHGNGLFVAAGFLGSQARSATSSNATSWTTHNVPGLAGLTSYTMAYGDGLFVAPGWSVTSTTNNGVDWKMVRFPIGIPNLPYDSIAHGNNRFVTVGRGTISSRGGIGISTDIAKTWTIWDGTQWNLNVEGIEVT